MAGSDYCIALGTRASYSPAFLGSTMPCFQVHVARFLNGEAEVAEELRVVQTLNIYSSRSSLLTSKYQLKCLIIYKHLIKMYNRFLDFENGKTCTLS
ncbi:hypothetical protein HanRHA438_Chr07g0308621 [Helianthus annuus]|nr:hypothetical protein HanRHA438_Chr07g0308621 [Helianthus annuus]